LLTEPLWNYGDNSCSGSSSNILRDLLAQQPNVGCGLLRLAASSMQHAVLRGHHAQQQQDDAAAQWL